MTAAVLSQTVPLHVAWAGGERGNVVVFADYLIGLGLSRATMRSYLWHVTTAETWFRGHTHTTLEWAGPSEVAAYADTLVYSHSTRSQAAVAFHHYWEWKARTNPPLRALRVPPRPVMVCRALTDDQATALVKASLGWYPQGTAVLIGLYMALRRTEIAQAEWSRFEADREWYTVTGKGGRTAILPVHPVLRAELEVVPSSPRWVFPGRFGGPSASATVWAWAKEVAAAAGIDELRTHQLRHTALATANDRLGDLRAVQTFAIHQDPAQTAGYTRTTARRLRDVSDSLDYIGGLGSGE